MRGEHDSSVPLFWRLGRALQAPVLVLAGIVLVLAVLAAFVWFVPGPVNQDSLGASVAREADAATPEESPCEQPSGADADLWVCDLILSESGGPTAVYRVTTEGWGCWQATKASGTGPWERQLDGCVKLRDLL